MKIRVITTTIALLITSSIFADITVDTGRLQEDYPHWNLTDPSTTVKLAAINDFIENNANKDNIAVFDWDGTLYNEMIPCNEESGTPFCGQACYLLSTAAKSKQFDYDVFPTYYTQDTSLFQNVKDMVNFLEGKTNAPQENPAHTFLYGTFFAMMTPETVTSSVKEYLKEYTAQKNMFYPEFDVIQRMIDKGFNVFIVTGSNEYMVSAVLNTIQNQVKYKGDANYSFPESMSGIPYKKGTIADLEKLGHIIGNSPYLQDKNLLDKSTFSNVGDPSWTNNSQGDLYVIDGYGKQLVCENLEKVYSKPVIFVAGNSNGDFYDMGYVAAKTGTLSIAVNPRGDQLLALIAQHPDDIVTLKYDYNSLPAK